MNGGHGDFGRSVYELFSAVCDLPPSERARVLDDRCRDDDALRAKVQRLLDHDDPDRVFLDVPAALWGEPLGASASAPLPESIGPYRIIRMLGEGGMGVVYLASQASLQRTVALKVLRPGAVTGPMLDRFAHEREALARLQHPGIAQIYEAGTFEAHGAAQPFFAMEYVAGAPLLQYAQARRLDTKARLDLVAQICDAVHHAHQKGVIHRDLKPGNILVTEQGRAKVLDFGAARVADAHVRAGMARTTFGELIGTIAYMSPEQASGDPDAIDTRSDIYALGVVGYELLSGRLPHDVQDRTMREAARMIREDPPRPLSSATPALRGDVETIFAKALEHERARRYQSASEFAEDIRRYLRHEPIAARPASAIYQIRKFARRNTTLVASASAIVLLLVAGAMVVGALAIAIADQRDAAVALRNEAQQARAAAEEQAEISKVVSGFLEDVFAAGSPYVGDHEMTVAEALDIAAGRVAEKLARRPSIAAGVRLRLSSVYMSLGNLDASLEQARLALTHLQSAADAAPLDIALASASVGQLLLATGDVAGAETHLAEAVRLYELHASGDDPLRLGAVGSYCAVLLRQGRFDEAIPRMVENLRRCEAVHGPNHPYTLTALNNLAMAYQKTGRLAEAEPLLRRNMDAQLSALGETHPNAITGIYNYASLLATLERFDEADALFNKCIDLAAEHLPTNHWQIGMYRNGYGDMLRRAGRYADAEAQLLDSYHILRDQLGESHYRTVRAVERLVMLYEAWQKSAAAARWRPVLHTRDGT